MRRAPVLLAVVAALLAPTLARGNDPLYPVTSFPDWLGGTQESFQNSSGTYTFEAGWSDAFERIYEQLQAHAGEPPSEQLQVVIDSLAHMRPDLPYTHIMDAGDPAYSPDWNHDGSFGDTREQTKNRAPGDFDADVDSVQDTAYFRYPCLNQSDGWKLHYVATNGTCNGRAPNRLGVAREVSVIGARGLVMDGTLWIPSDAFKRGACPALSSTASRARWNCVRSSSFSGKRFPGIVFNDGIASIQQHYYWIAERLVASGYIVLTYDPVGQGRSEGNMVDLFGVTLPKASPCIGLSACIDAQDMTRWFTGRWIVRVADNGPRAEPRQDPARNAANPVLPILDTSRVGMSGHSMGAITTLAYTKALGEGHGYDGRPVPPLRAAVPLSGMLPTHASVPTEFITSDYDGSPTTIAPEVAGVELGGRGEGIGYHSIKGGYDTLRKSSDRGPLSLLVLEGGVHEDFVSQPPIFRTTWSLGLGGWYTAAWFDCWVKGVPAACVRARTPVTHLSKAYASEQDPDGPKGLQPSWCMTVPTEAVLSMTPQEFVAAEAGKPPYNCRVR
jgi:dienelactone hydrolase